MVSFRIDKKEDKIEERRNEEAQKDSIPKDKGSVRECNL